MMTSLYFNVKDFAICLIKNGIFKSTFCGQEMMNGFQAACNDIAEFRYSFRITSFARVLKYFIVLCNAFQAA